MASGVGKHKLSLGPTEPWSVREKLCLASSVMKSGDQNWVSVSRAIRPFAEPGRPPDWFSQKHCASQYSELLETTEAPKRKRGEKGEVVETIEDVIVRKLTAERIEELKRLIRDTQEKHRKLKREAELIQAGHLDSKLEELWGEIVQKKKQEDEEAEVKRKATETAYEARQAVKNTPRRMPSVAVGSPPGEASLNLDQSGSDQPIPTPTPDDPSSTGQGTAVFIPLPEVSASSVSEPCLGGLLVQKATPPPSPLLSELLKKGNLLATSPRLVADGDLPTCNMTGMHGIDLQVTATALPASQAASAEVKQTLGEEDLMNVSYMEDELDLDTMGDIIAIMENKARENAEALDAAAVEAALSLCEDAGHSLTGPWEVASSFKPPDAVDSTLAEGSLRKREATDATRAVSVSDSQDRRRQTFPATVPGSVTRAHTHGPALPCDSDSVVSGEQQEKNGLSCPTVAIKCGTPPPNTDSMTEEDPALLKLSKEVKEEEVDEEEEEEEEEEDVVSDGADGGVGELAEGVECGLGEAAEGRGAEGELELEPAASESEDGCSLHTASSSLQLHATADSIPSSPASSQFSICSEDQEAIQAQKIWKKAIMLVWRAAANHRYANVFLQPVTDDIAPGYHSIVYRPMDLSTIKKNIEIGAIRNTAEFQRDIMLMFQNAVMYNSSDHDVFHMALEMQRDVLEQVQQFLATQLIMQTSESGISSKSLRGREANHKQDPSDKDTLPMASPAFLLSLFDGGTRGRRCAIEADQKMKK
ncbi:bromodomain-containing protein 8 isoform X5 [Alosa pseudoharengus]|uniref:bromodomain-containing protein 8 isoform X5 n=1 Tax=Alosa pseudoharengus TaxID=34774 RepID=UPI003F8A8D19